MDDNLMVGIDEETREVQDGFAVRDLASADWCLRKIAWAERRVKMRKAFVEERKRQLDEWEAKANAVDFSTSERMAEFLRPWAEAEVAADGKRKSVSLPTGTVGFRQGPDAIEVLDNDKAVADLEKNADWCVRVKKEVNKVELMKAIKAGGALPEGCELRPGVRRFYVDVREKEA